MNNTTQLIYVSGSLDAKIYLFYTADWSTMNVIDDEILSPVISLDVSQDSTFLMAGETALKSLESNQSNTSLK